MICPSHAPLPWRSDQGRPIGRCGWRRGGVPPTLGLRRFRPRVTQASRSIHCKSAALLSAEADAQVLYDVTRARNRPKIAGLWTPQRINHEFSWA